MKSLLNTTISYGQKSNVEQTIHIAIMNTELTSALRMSPCGILYDNGQRTGRTADNETYQRNNLIVKIIGYINSSRTFSFCFRTPANCINI